MSRFQVQIKDSDLFDVYYIIENEGHFGVEKNGCLIGEIQHNESWEQVSGEPLPKNVLHELITKIESYYD